MGGRVNRTDDRMRYGWELATRRLYDALCNNLRGGGNTVIHSLRIVRHVPAGEGEMNNGICHF